MIRFMRSGAGSIVSKILLGLLIISFAIWGVEDMLQRGMSGGAIAKVGDESITPPMFEQMLRRKQEQVGSMLGATSPEQLKGLKLERAVLQDMITESLLRQEVASLGLRPSDANVATHIRNDPTFKDDKGNFDKSRFLSLLKNSGMSEAAYAARVRNELSTNALLRVLGDTAMASDIEATTALEAAAEQRNLHLITVKQEALPALPDDATLDAFYATETERFLKPETRDIAWLILPSQKPEVEDALAGGATLEEVAKQYNLTLGRSGPLERDGTLPNGEKATLPAALLDAAFRLNEGADSAVLPAGGGDKRFFLVRAEKVALAHTPPLAEVKDQVAKAWQTAQAKEATRAKAEALAGDLAKASNTEGKEAVLKEHGATLVSVGSVKRADTKTTGGVALPPALLKEAFTLSQGQNTTAYAQGEDYVIALLNDITPLSAKPREDDMKTLRETLDRRAQNEVLEQFLSALQTREDVRVNDALLGAYAREGR